MWNKDLDQALPCVDDMEKAAKRRIPHFAFEYLYGGIGREAALERNRAMLDAVTFAPRYLVDEPGTDPDLSVNVLGQQYALPFGISPIGLSGLVWPQAAEILAKTAKENAIPMGLSTFATSKLEDIANENIWFQLYIPNDPDIYENLIHRAETSGVETLIITLDIPTRTRRDRDLRAGLSVPPKLTTRTLVDILTHPQWALATLYHGKPAFKTLQPYIPARANLEMTANFLADMIEGPVTRDILARVRERWKGKLVVKGVLSIEDAAICKSTGADAIWVSNHGGRQLDAARSPVEVLPDIRRAVGKGLPIFADSGPRTGLDIMRMLAMGADFVFLGRAFMYGLAAIGHEGPAHVIAVLREELRSSLVQIGCAKLNDLPSFIDTAP